MLFIKTNFEESVWCGIKKTVACNIKWYFLVWFVWFFFFIWFFKEFHYILIHHHFAKLKQTSPILPNQSKENFKQVRWRFLMIFSMSSSERFNDIVKMNGTHTNHMFDKTWQPSIYISLVFLQCKMQNHLCFVRIQKKLKQKKKIGKLITFAICGI